MMKPYELMLNCLQVNFKRVLDPDSTYKGNATYGTGVNETI